MPGSLQDVVIVGGGHNGLVAAAYLAAAGRSVTLLERLPHVGGAAVSAPAFAGVDARLSRYSYLVSLLPQQVLDDLGLDIRLQRRRISSYTPRPGTDRGLLVDGGDPQATADSFASIGAASDATAWQDFYGSTGRLARAVFPTMLDPLPTRSALRRAVADDALWQGVVDRPIGELIESSFDDDLVRGVVLTDALIGTFASATGRELAANRCFLYHVIGGGTGEWSVPIGGMGAVSGALEAAARASGARIVTGAEVTNVTPDGEVSYRVDDREHRIVGRTVLSGVAPWELARLLGEEPPAESRPEGAQVKVNLLLRRLPRLLDAAMAPADAFGGTFHINETYSGLESAYREAAAGRVPAPIPAEIYCHSLSDPRILSPELAASGAHTLTVFALHAPDRLIDPQHPDASRASLERAVLDSLDSVLGEPVEPLLLTDSEGRPTIETKTTRDIEDALRMPGGHIFHGPLDWPFLEDDAEPATPAERWGVATAHDRILLCGSGARRGGGVSGLGGRDAAMAVLEQRS